MVETALRREPKEKTRRVFSRLRVDLTTDLHSMGQFIQDGARIMFETVIEVEESRENITIGEEPVDLDGLNYLAGQTVDFVNKCAMKGTMLAHTDGNVPNLLHSCTGAERVLAWASCSTSMNLPAAYQRLSAGRQSV